MTIGQVNGCDVIVSGSEDASARVWDLAGQPLSQPLTGHTGTINSVAVGLDHGLSFQLASGD